MNNSGAIYVEHSDHAAVAAAIGQAMTERGFVPVDLPPGADDGRIMIPAKRRRLFGLLPARDGWVTVWESPGYFGERALAAQLAAALATRAVWLEVSGNGVGWAHGLYQGAVTLEERYDEVETTFYGEYGLIHFSYDIDQMPGDFIAALGLPYDELSYEALLTGELPADAGLPLHFAYAR